MMIRCANGAVLILDQCHWTEGAYLSLTHMGGTGTVLDLDAIEKVQAELERVKHSILERRVKQRRVAG